MSKEKSRVGRVSFFLSYKEAIDILPDNDQKLSAYEMIFDYAFFGIEPDFTLLSFNLKLLFTSIRANIDAGISNSINGGKGGRPRKNSNKQSEECEGDSPLETPVKSPLKNNKDKDKDKEKDENKNPFPYSTGEKQPPSADAGGASPFTFIDVQECVEEYGIDLNDKGQQAFYRQMEKYGWQINGNRVTMLENAVSGYAKKHPNYQNKSVKQEEQSNTFNHVQFIKRITENYVPQDVLANCVKTKRRWMEEIPNYCTADIFSDVELNFLHEKGVIFPEDDRRQDE